MNGLSLEAQYYIVRAYAMRQQVAYNLQESITQTEDLDGILMFKPWVPERKETYSKATKDQLISPLFC